MKWKQLETVPARTPKTDAYMATVEELGNVLILDVWENRVRKFRYCIDVETGQHGYLEETWSRGKLLTALGTNPNYYWPKDVRYPAIDRKEKQHCLEKLSRATKDVYQAIDWEEAGYDRDKRWDAEKNRQDRLDAYMEQAPEIPENLREWLFEKAAGEDYLMKTRKKRRVHLYELWGKVHEERTPRKPAQSIYQLSGMQKIPADQDPGRTDSENHPVLSHPADRGRYGTADHLCSHRVGMPETYSHSE